MDNVMIAGVAGSMAGSTAALAANSVAPAPPGMEWVAWIVSLLSAFGPLAISLFLRWRSQVRLENRAKADRMLHDKDASNDAEARTLQQDAVKEEVVLEAAQKVVDIVQHLPPPAKK